MLKERLRAGGALWGSWVQVGHPANAEILAGAGFVWLALDCEHGDAGETDIAAFCRAAALGGAAPLVRLRESAVMDVRRALDLGAAGVIAPLVDTPETARRVAAAARHPPAGVRGFAWHRGNAWGRDFDAYAKDFDPVVVAMVESREAVERIDEIAAVEGVDALLVGPYDLSGSYGLTGQPEHPTVERACAAVAAACRRHGKAAGRHMVEPSDRAARDALAQGYTFLALGMDTVFLRRGAEGAFASARAAEAARGADSPTDPEARR